jgi:phage terminase large subunit GpA-like protein
MIEAAGPDFSNMAGLISAIRASSKALRPPADLRPSEWAEQNVRIPVGNAIPGMIRFDNAPYQREPLDMIADPDCERISLMWGAQVGKTLTALCAQGYRIAHDPVSQIMAQPSLVDLKTWLRTKFDPLIDANDVLKSTVAVPRARDGVNNETMKSYPGGFMMFAWAGSPKTFRGRSAPFIVCDEVDGYDRTDEGHPVSLLWQRAATFGDQRLLLEISTPTRKGASKIETSFIEGDQRYFHVPCPDCGEFQRLEWSHVSWSRDDDGMHLPRTAMYVCSHCGSCWTDGQRHSAIRRGKWIATHPFRGHASYHLSELYSCFRRLSEIVQSFLDKKAAGDLQTFVNVSLAETWEEEGDSVDASGLMGRAEKFPDHLPAGVAVLTAGVDMQADRLEIEIVGWGLGEESWSIEHRVLWGNPLQSEVWEDLEDVLAETWPHATGATVGISATALDTGGEGGMTSAAYGWVEKKRGSRIFAIKGVGGWDRPIVSAPSRKRSGRRQRKIDLFTVGVDEAKLVVMRRLQLDAEGPGYCHLPDGRDPEWFAQLTAETLRRRYVKGFPILEWHKTRERNEALDCRVYALAALKILSPSIPRILERLRESDDDEDPQPRRGSRARMSKPPEAQPDDEGQSAPKRGRRIARGRRTRRGR